LTDISEEPDAYIFRVVE